MDDLRYKTVFNEDGSIRFIKKEDEKKGKKSRSSGSQFEARVRKDLEEKGWIVDKWSNNVDLDDGRVVPAKRKFNPFSKVMTIGTGFPDFVAFQTSEDKKYNVVGVEVKVNGTLSRKEKEKCRFYLDKNIFSEIWVAERVKEKNKIRVSYVSVNDILERMR